MSSRDKHNRDRLIERHLPLARAVARRYFVGREPMDDLFQVACEALVKAAHSYDPDRGHAFSSYAVPCMAGAIKRHFRDHVWILQVSRPIKDLAVLVNKAAPRLELELGREPDDAELAAALGADAEAVRDARAAMRADATFSLDAPQGGHDNTDLGFDVAAPPDVQGDEIDPFLRFLPMRERTVVKLRFRHELTQGEIAARVGLSQMHVCRILRNSLAQLSALPEVRELAAAP
ncbi:MAG TPA: sigma-70 family RNA polymerase sigma factor [Thermoleophilaceae bacterium]|nr:sigma-70 family RNA polymerase sigma factor [Thermoleophilaceae bacterium]